MNRKERRAAQRAARHKPKRQRQVRIAVNPVVTALSRVVRLSGEHIDMQRRIILGAIATLADERATDADCKLAWGSLADAANMAEALSGMGLGSGDDAARVIREAQATLADLHQRAAADIGARLTEDGVEHLHWLARLHDMQLQATSYGEFERAFKLCEARARTFRAMPAPPAGVTVLEGGGFGGAHVVKEAA